MYTPPPLPDGFSPKIASPKGQRWRVGTATPRVCAYIILLELELELIQSHMAQKPMLRGDFTPPEVANTGSGVNRGSGGGVQGCGFEERAGVHARTGGSFPIAILSFCVRALKWQFRSAG